MSCKLAGTHGIGANANMPVNLGEVDLLMGVPSLVCHAHGLPADGHEPTSNGLLVVTFWLHIPIGFCILSLVNVGGPSHFRPQCYNKVPTHPPAAASCECKRYEGPTVAGAGSTNSSSVKSQNKPQISYNYNLYVYN